MEDGGEDHCRSRSHRTGNDWRGNGVARVMYSIHNRERRREH
jgi:hypothetical protein